MQPHRWQHLVKPKHELRFELGLGAGRAATYNHDGLKRVHVGFYEDRDVQGTFVHWEWLMAKWRAEADKLEGFEQRGVFG